MLPDSVTVIANILRKLEAGWKMRTQGGTGPVSTLPPAPPAARSRVKVVATQRQVPVPER